MRLTNIETVEIVNADTGVLLHTLTPFETILGREYWVAWCRGRYYQIEEEVLEPQNKLATYYVR